MQRRERLQLLVIFAGFGLVLTGLLVIGARVSDEPGGARPGPEQALDTHRDAVEHRDVPDRDRRPERKRSKGPGERKTDQGQQVNGDARRVHWPMEPIQRPP